MCVYICVFLTINFLHFFGQIPANVNKVGVEAFTDSLSIIYICIINKQLKRKAIDFIVLHDGIYTRQTLFCITIIEKIKVILSFKIIMT